MDKEQIGMCGAYCGVCDWKEKTGCPGCQGCKGKMFWGECPTAKCCGDKGLTHCGNCSEVPCDTLGEVFDSPEHGDNGERLANLKSWAKGEDSFVEIGTFKKGDS